MRWKKWLIIIGIVLAILAVRAHYVVMRGYWYWSVPDSLLARVNFDRLIESTDAMLADDYEDVTEYHTKDPSICTVLIRQEEDAEQLRVVLTMIKDAYYSELWSGILCKGSTRYNPNYSSQKNEFGLLYHHFVEVHSDMGQIYMSFDTKHPLDGRRRTIDFLNDLCDKYCAPSDD